MTKRIVAGAVLAVIGLFGITAATAPDARGGFGDWPVSATR